MTPLPTILSAVAAEFGVTVDDLTGRSCADRVTWPRLVAMYVIRTHQEPPFTLQQTSDAVGGRTPSGVRRGILNVIAALDEVDGFRERVERIRTRVIEVGARAIEPETEVRPVCFVPPLRTDRLGRVAPGTYPAGRFSMLGGTVRT